MLKSIQGKSLQIRSNVYSSGLSVLEHSYEYGQMIASEGQ